MSSLKTKFLSFSVYRENPVLDCQIVDSFQTMDWFVDSFRGVVLKTLVILPAKFGVVWTRFDPRIIEFWIEPRKTEFLGSGLKFFYHRLNRHHKHDASVQPVSRFLASWGFLRVVGLHRCFLSLVHRFIRCYFYVCFFGLFNRRIEFS